MFPKILLARKPVSCTPVAIGIGTHERLLGVRILLVDFALVAKQAA
jgi:hypothetical protein